MKFFGFCVLLVLCLFFDVQSGTFFFASCCILQLTYLIYIHLHGIVSLKLANVYGICNMLDQLDLFLAENCRRILESAYKMWVCRKNRVPQNLINHHWSCWRMGFCLLSGCTQFSDRHISMIHVFPNLDC